ncbi:MAG TPA: class I SAM-dependent methyltransferase [Chitinophagaceae bacterium]|nr:class I SAM-dependent methyltransferase [Chitinophagaceae bacterium]
MKFNDGVSLISSPALHSAVPTHWADLGCGAGFFTNVLSSLLVKGSTIYAMDSDAPGLKKVKVAEGIQLKTFAIDFVKEEWPFNKVNGIIMANALHYVKDKGPFIKRLRQHILADGLLLVVEYDMDAPNPWVPYPISFEALKKLCTEYELFSPKKTNEMPSAFGRANLYGAVVRM